MEKLSRSASGLRHLRWSREILATLEAHYEHNPRLSQPEREAVLEEAIKLRSLVTALSEAVKPYRDFLERRRVQFRGMQRVGRFLCEGARARAEKSLLPHGAEGLLSGDGTRKSRGLAEGPKGTAELTREAAAAMRSIGRSIPDLAPISDELTEAAAILEGFNEAFANLEARERLPLKTALESAIESLRQALTQMDGRLGTLLSPALVESLYPKLTRDGSIVADEGDEDDDAAAKP
jgi:hypothetical protein